MPHHATAKQSSCSTKAPPAETVYTGLVVYGTGTRCLRASATNPRKGFSTPQACYQSCHPAHWMQKQCFFCHTMWQLVQLQNAAICGGIHISSLGQRFFSGMAEMEETETKQKFPLREHSAFHLQPVSISLGKLPASGKGSSWGRGASWDAQQAAASLQEKSLLFCKASLQLSNGPCEQGCDSFLFPRAREIKIREAGARCEMWAMF